MSNNIDVKFTADTASAVAEVDKLKAATHEQVTAGDLAGASMKELGKELQRVKANTIENTEATRKAKEATADHALTVQKFGAESKEAAAAQAKLTAAEKEAERTAAVLADTMKRVAVAVGETGKQADGTMTPAAARATKQLASMSAQAERNAADMKRLELQGQKNAWSFDLAGMASGKLASVLGPAALAGTVMGLASWLSEAGEKTLQYETAVKNLPFALTGAQDATRGLMSESALAVTASQALALGVVKTGGEFSQLASDAAKIALKLGTSTDQMLGDLTTALGRGSAMILDNAGIILKVSDANEAYAASIGKSVSELNELEKKQAFQIAAMAAIRKSADETTVAYDSHAASVLRLKTQAGDAWDKMSRGAVNFFGAVVESAQAPAVHMEAMIQKQLDMQRAIDMTNQSVMRAQGWSQEFKDLSVNAGKAATDLLGMSNVIAMFSNPAMIEEGKALIAQEEKKKTLLTEEAVQAERIEKAMKKIAGENEAFLDEQAYLALKGPQPAKKEKKKGGPKKKKAEVMDPGDVARARIFDGRELGDSVSTEAAWTQVQIEEDAAQALYDVKIAAFERDLELLEARGEADAEAQAAREALLTRRQEVEEDFAKQQFDMAREDAKREAATTKMEALEHKKRLAALRKQADAEAAEMSKKTVIMEKVTGRVTDLGTAMVDAAWQAAEGQKGAGLKALGDYLKTVSKQMAVKALVETAMGAAALAGVVTAGLAPGHFAAAGIAAAAAVAAGGAGIGLSAAGEARAGDSKASTPTDAANDSGMGSSAKSSAGLGGGRDRPEKREMEAQTVPISYLDSGRVNTAAANHTTVYNLDLSRGTWQSGGPESAAQSIRKTLRQGGAAGPR